jgi:hypothetical protein
MPPAGFVLAALAVWGIWTGLHKTVTGVKHLDQKVAAHIHHAKKTAPSPATPHATMDPSPFGVTQPAPPQPPE